MSITIRATYDEPSMKNLWLVEIAGVNTQKFCGKRGNVLKSKEQDYLKCLNSFKDKKFAIVSADEFPKEKVNFIFNKIKRFSMSASDISYTFSFGFGNEIFGETMDEIENEIQRKLENCKKQIERTKKSEHMISKLLDEFKSHKNRR